MTFRRPEHRIIADLLARMDMLLLLNTGCFFGGGTAIVLLLGEYRRSLDIDFLCSSVSGYRQLRNAIAAEGAPALLPQETLMQRPPRIDQYGIRFALEHQGQPLKLEIIREARIDLTGGPHADLKVPTLAGNRRSLR